MGADWAGNVLERCLGLCPGESVLVMVDEPLGHAREALCAAAGRLGARQVQAYTLPGRPTGLEVVPRRLLEQVREADVLVSLLATLDLSQERAVLRAVAAEFHALAKGRWAYGAQIDSDVLAHELAGDYRAVERIARRLAAQLAGADEVRVTSAAGTDLSLRLGGRPLHVETGLLAGPGAFGNLPGGEVFAAPLEESAEGLLVVDACVGDLPLAEPLRLTFRQGLVASVEGGAAAAALKERLGPDPWAWTIGEFGVGANPFARVRGRVATDEKALGTLHIALGGNLRFGGRNPARTHYDCVIRAPRVLLGPPGAVRTLDLSP